MSDDEARLRALFERHHARLLAYALRRTASRADADDVVAATFAVAWRRLADVPTGDPELPWLYAVARRVLANQRRGAQRFVRLAQRWRAEPVTHAAAQPDLDDRDRVRRALTRLRPADQEVLRLHVWEELDHGAIAQVLGCSVNAVAIRAHRARKRLRVELEADDSAQGRDRRGNVHAAGGHPHQRGTADSGGNHDATTT